MHDALFVDAGAEDTLFRQLSILSDQAESLRIVTDISGTVFRRLDYDSFGNIISPHSSPAPETPFGFAGGLHDRDTGPVRFGYRDYDPDTGRWTAKVLMRALASDEKNHGAEHPSVAGTLSNLATVCEKLGRYKEAGPLFRRALAVNEKILGTGHPDIAPVLGNLAGLCMKLEKYEEAERFYRRDPEIEKKALGAEHPSVAITLNNLAELYGKQDRYEEAEALCRQALEIMKKVPESDHPNVAAFLANLADLYKKQGKLCGS